MGEYLYCNGCGKKIGRYETVKTDSTEILYVLPFPNCDLENINSCFMQAYADFIKVKINIRSNNDSLLTNTENPNQYKIIDKYGNSIYIAPSLSGNSSILITGGWGKNFYLDFDNYVIDTVCRYIENINSNKLSRFFSRENIGKEENLTPIKYDKGNQKTSYMMYRIIQ